MDDQVKALFRKADDQYKISFLVPPLVIPEQHYKESLERFKFDGAENMMRSQFVFRAAVRAALRLLDYAESLDSDVEEKEADGEVEVSSPEQGAT